MMSPTIGSTGSTPDREHHQQDTLADICDLMRGEYAEMPGLCLTLRQAMRLWSLDREPCERALEALVLEGFLYLSPDGMYRVPRLV